MPLKEKTNGKKVPVTPRPAEGKARTRMIPGFSYFPIRTFLPS